MGPLNLGSLRTGARVLLDTPPIIYRLEGHPTLARRFEPLFERHAAGEIRFAITTIGLAEVLAGPLMSGDEILAGRYRKVLGLWDVVDLDADIAEGAARLRASLGLKLVDAVQVASAVAIGADALVTHDRDFRRVKSIPVLT
jgi:predicted nucleic acid-binding protein